ncbi:uncharacterized protein ANIA_11338 [Aspergillus nidulans FGSC A4]|uniref:Uncharacterized protein n=1 Tax=Emericella nidulans (strain FGSC A4 / ATCC 38163 / CBS 112.46 / NRRL 194 / M139) TaxID=227321 RepID=C8VNX2_EMENI|nr:hypothetical protein [Aspergillus nidulans FGSC A4]CBF86794.1 TPA: hypothetical protein ANIA_11338 [Aspergillus nidulans FGSC A4]
MTYLLKWERNDMGCGDYLRAVFSAENADVQLAREALEAFAWRHEASSYHNAVLGQASRSFKYVHDPSATRNFNLPGYIKYE